jgi:hypothetical protein
LIGVAMATKDEKTLLRVLPDVTDQALLAEIARIAKEPDVRRRAVNEMARRLTLEGTPWDGKPPDPQVTARKLAGQAAFARIAKTDSDPRVRQAAVYPIRDQAVLAEVARTDVSPLVRVTAVQRLRGQELLAEVVKTDQDAGVRLAAVRNIGGRALRAEIAKTDPDPDVRAVAEGQAPPESHVYQTVVLSFNSVRRTLVWSAPVSDQFNQNANGLHITRDGWEFAVVRLKVWSGQGYTSGVQGYCGWVVGIDGKKYPSAVAMQPMVADSDYECPFLVPEAAKLATFHVDNLTFDIPE